MYDDGDLLQANVTLIAGVLIFLTLSPISRGAAEILVRRYTLVIIWITLTLLTFSIVTLTFLPKILPQEEFWTFTIPRAFFIAGTIGIISAVAGIVSVLSMMLRGQNHFG